MSSGSVRKFLPSLKLKLGTKTVICAIVLIAMNTGLVVGAAYWSLTSEFNARALRDIEANLRTLAMTFSETYSDAKIVMKDGIVARAEIAKMPEFKDHAIVDRAVSYVGVPMAQFEGMLAQTIQTMAIAAGIAALLVLILTMLVVRRITKPLTSVTASLTAIANGNSDVEIDCHDRMDEIGEIARTIAVFKNNSQERQ